MGYVGTGQSGHTYIGSGIGASGTFKQMGTNSNLTAHGVVVAEGNSPFVAVGPTATTGAVLQNNAGADPSYSTASYPSTTVAGSILYSPSANVVDDLTTTPSATLVSNSSAVPVWTSSMTNGQVVIGSTGGTPTAATLTAGSGIAITNAAASITIATQPVLVAGSTNLGISYSGGTFTVHGADGTALSASNPAYVTLQSKATPGYLVTIPVTANQTMTTASIGNNLFSLTTAVDISVDIPFYLYAVMNDSANAIAFMMSRIPNAQVAPASAKIAQSGNTNATTQGSFFSLATITATDYDLNPCICLGSFRMRYASSQWTVQTLDSLDGIGQYQDRFFTCPRGQYGAASGKYFFDNGGTAPDDSGANYTYFIDRQGVVFGGLQMPSATTAGVGAVNLNLLLPVGSSGGIISVGYLSGGGNYYIMESVCTTSTISYNCDLNFIVSSVGNQRMLNTSIIVGTVCSFKVHYTLSLL